MGSTGHHMSLQGGQDEGHKSLRRVAPLPCAVLREYNEITMHARGLEYNEIKGMAFIAAHVTPHMVLRSY